MESVRPAPAIDPESADQRTRCVMNLPAVLCAFLAFGSLARAIPFDEVPFTTIQRATLSDERLAGHDNRENRLTVGTIVLYRTDQGRFGKLQIQGYGYDIILRWVTYSADGSVFSSGENLEVNGTYFCDLDAGLEVDRGNGEDFHWDQRTEVIRDLQPERGAAFAVLEQPALILPQIADGAGIRTEVILSNPDSALKGKVRFRTPGGAPLELSVDGVVCSTVPVDLRSGGVVKIKTDGLGELKAGYAFIETDPPGRPTRLAGSVVYQYRGFEASVAAAAPSFQNHVFIERTAGADTGLAILNLGPLEQSVRTVLRNKEGLSVGEVFLILQAGEHRARFVSEMFGGVTAGFQGSIHLYAQDQGVCLLAVRQESTGSVAILPGAPTALVELVTVP